MDIINIKRIIDAWDPIDLLPYAPNDEYDSEIMLLENYLNEQGDNLDVEKLSKKIKEIFEKRFGSDVFKKNLPECKMIAEAIVQAMVK